MTNMIETCVKWIACIFVKNIIKNWQFMPSNVSITLSLNAITQCKYWMWFLLNIFDISHFYLLGGLRNFMFIYIWEYDISFSFAWKLIRFHFYSFVGTSGLVGFYCIVGHSWLFDAKPSLYVYIKYILFGLVGFCGFSTTVGYLMSSPLYTCILSMYDLVRLGFMAYQTL